MQFKRLRLSGFKSFVEPTDFLIEPGLTGVVGPNGCGKSNLVEALRWVMGENSAKRMRGGAMDDVIFAGTSNRPPRNLAEVSVHLDNRDRSAPADYNGSPEIEISRRIEREMGSAFRINGREVRARDVQLLFADIATGAHSTAMVSQGRVGAIISAKPTDRRALLEEAAGITGLHSRRHEAELRLKAAETNLERLADVAQQLEQQLQGLKRQARQASRYRNISGHIRRAEAIVFHLRYVAAARALEEAKTRLAEAEADVAARTSAAAIASTAQAGAAEALPPLRHDEAAAAAALHRLAVARDGLDAEERRAREQQAQLEDRHKQIDGDLAREHALHGEAGAAISRLELERGGIAAARSGEAEAVAAAEAKVAAAAAEVAERQRELDALTEKAAAEAARRNALGEQIAARGERIARLVTRSAEVETERVGISAEGEDLSAAAAADTEVAAQQQRMMDARARLDETEKFRATAQFADRSARELLQEAQALASRLAAEEKGLSNLLAIDESSLWPPLIDAVSVAPGFETALGVALGDDLRAAADSAAPIHWQVLPPLADAPALPAGTEPLANHVRGPQALARRLSQIGVVSEEDGARLSRDLKQGQRLVTKSGALWRWDGFTQRTGAPSAAAVRLEQRNRLADLREQLRAAEAALAGARADFEAAHTTFTQSEAAESEARAAARQAETAFDKARDSQTKALQLAAARASKLAALNTAAEQIAADLTESREQLAAAEAELAQMPAETDARERIGMLRLDLDGYRNGLGEARSDLDRLHNAAQVRIERLAAIERETQSWSDRLRSSTEQIAELEARREAVEAEIAAIRDLPAEIAARRVRLLEQIGLAEIERNRAADALAVAETALAECDKAVKAANGALGQARETRVRAEAEAEHAEQQRADLDLRIRETLESHPEQVLAAAEIDEDEQLPALSEIEMKLDRLKKERDGMGPVNLRAEIEADEVETQLNTLITERGDLEAAIGRLRQGIASLNREGRERLLAAFKKVDEHFQELFVKVFGGGRAHLALTESDDPLEAGLEIMASPPGKKLQVLSLLSGGEQALTALSLLFAVFLTNPAPICVLDEVDAPLDDANVERLCDLLDNMASGGDTRFLVVTHHPITMARMDRLFGVTMAERGVSQLVSVDLAAAEALRQTA
ncbi:MAG TPA: chromosome segregation protein SMC [Candidatus Cybelea sp.]|nr:chromosome segregation protein SMC [Candidatus Cybelea sp.]